MINTINIKLATSSHTQLKSLANLVIQKNQGLSATWRQLLHQTYMYKNTKMRFTVLDVYLYICADFKYTFICTKSYATQKMTS